MVTVVTNLESKVTMVTNLECMVTMVTSLECMVTMVGNLEYCCHIKDVFSWEDSMPNNCLDAVQVQQVQC